MTSPGTTLRRTLSFDLDEDPPLSVLISKAIAEEADVDVFDLEPVGECVDLSDLESLIRSLDNNPQGSATITFPVADYLVTVRSDKTILIKDR